MSRRTTTEVVTPHHAGKPASFAYAGYVDVTLTVEDIDQHLVADFRRTVAAGFRLAFRRLRGRFGAGAVIGFDGGGFDCDFAHELHWRQVVLVKMPLHGLGDVLAFHELHQTDLGRVVSVFGRALDLRDHAGARLEHRHRMHVALIVVNLGHSDLFTENAVNHGLFSSSSLTRDCRFSRLVLGPLAFSQNRLHLLVWLTTKY